MDTNLFDDYSLWTDRVAVYPKVHEPHYLALGLCEEMSEMYRAQSQSDIVAEVGDVLWYGARYARLVLNVSFSSIAQGQAAAAALRWTPMEALGIIAGVEKKRLRDGETWDQEKIDAKHAQAKDALIVVVAEALRTAWHRSGVSPEGVIAANKAKLSARLEASTIRGDGDHR